MAGTAGTQAGWTLQEAAAVGMTAAYHAAQDPDRVAIIAPQGTRTFDELNAHTNQLVRALRRHGVQAGDRVGFLSRNRPEFAEVLEATRRSGIRMTPINWHLTADEVAYILEDSGATAFIADAGYGDVALEAVDAVPGCRVRIAVAGAIDTFERFEDVLDKEDPSDIEDPRLEQPLFYTSGTTGRPKGVIRFGIAGGNVTTSAALGRMVGGEHLMLCTGPLYHGAPLSLTLWAPLSAGVGVVIMDGWDSEEMLRLVERHRVTHVNLVPTMFHRLLALPEDVRKKYDLSSLQVVAHGAAPCPVPVKQAMIEWFGPIINEYYSSTEGFGSWVDSETWLKKPGTVGKPPTDDHVKVFGEDGQELPPNQIGIVYLKAANTGGFEYYHDADKTKGSHLPDRAYFSVGDVGYLDEDGYLFLTDRSADLIISGGVNIYPAEVDAVLLTHPAVADVATIGVPNVEWGEEVKAVVEPKSEVEPSPALADELIEFCRERLARYKCPKTVDFVEQLPREDSGKIFKRRLREAYRSSTETANQE